jgi:hypothetical protein
MCSMQSDMNMEHGWRVPMCTWDAGQSFDIGSACGDKHASS